MNKTRCSQDGCEYDLINKPQFWIEIGAVASSQSFKSISEFRKQVPVGFKDYIAGGFIEQTEEGEIQFNPPQNVLDDAAEKAIKKAEEEFNDDVFRERWGGTIDGEYYCGDEEGGNSHYQKNK